MISVETKYQHNIRSTVGRDFTYRFSIEDFRDALIRALIGQFGKRIDALVKSHEKVVKTFNDKVNKLEASVKNLEERQEKSIELISQLLDKFPSVKNKRKVARQMYTDLTTKNIKPEIEIGNLATYSDGTIRFKGSVIPMRDQLNDLCRMFMNRPDQLVLCDEIREEIIRANRRAITKFSTIAKYVSELHGLLKLCFSKDVIFNHKKEGWRFVP
jgi:Mg2+ and Co2+ transporter CorA